MSDLAEKRKKFRARLRDLIESMPRLGVKSGKEIMVDPKAVLVVTRVEDFDLESNELWEIELNRSFPRDGVACANCKKPCVMSNEIWNSYKFCVDPPRVMCGVCLFGMFGIKK